MKFCAKCNTTVLDYEADAVPLNELQTQFAIVIRWTICNHLIQYKNIIHHEENRIDTNSTTAQHSGLFFHFRTKDSS
jgi:hypothetical protein